jgi:hypothetical protein
LEFCTGNEKGIHCAKTIQFVLLNFVDADSTACQADFGGGYVLQHPKIHGRFFLQVFRFYKM